MKLEGNTILITGGGTGIGLGLAKAFTELGNKVIIAGRRLEKLEEAKSEVPELEIVQGDIGTAESVKALADKVISNYPDINVLLNNAGIMISQNITRTEENLEDLVNQFDINTKGTIRMNSAFMDTLKKNEGTIINVTSGLAFIPNVAVPIYSASKAALHSYSITLRQQLAGKVEVIELAPPLVATDLSHCMGEGIPTDEFVKETMEKMKEGKEVIAVGLAEKLLEMSKKDPDMMCEKMRQNAWASIPP